MKRSHPILFTLACLLALSPLTVHAEALTDEKVQSFISSLETLQGMEDEFEELNEDLATEEDATEMPDMSRIFSSSVEKMKGHEMHDRLEEVVQQHGFSSPEEWGRTGDRIFQAWSALEMGEQSGQVDQEMAKAMEEIDNNPNMSEAQKQQMREMMSGAMSAYKQAANAPEADKRAVRPHIEALRGATESDE
jgi:protein-tyrosine-phosphatase